GAAREHARGAEVSAGMSRVGASLLLCGLLAGFPLRAAPTDRAERARLQAALASARASESLLKDQKIEVLETLELAERLYRLSEERLQRAEREVQALQRRRALTERLTALATASLEAQLKALGPRLRLMDRRTRRRPLDVLLSSESFSSLVWRQRALATLVAQDVEAVKRAERTRAFQERLSDELGHLESAVAERLVALRDHRAREREQRAVLTDLVNLVQAQEAGARRLVNELEQAERKLARFLAQQARAPETSGFGALRGKLPRPSEGPILLGFGPVEHPTFKTVTEHKGVDIGAPAGAPVHAVAEGKVAYAGWMRGYGNLLVVDHGSGYHTLVAHLAELLPKVGDAVAVGERIGRVGDTGSLKGAYLYFEL